MTLNEPLILPRRRFCSPDVSTARDEYGFLSERESQNTLGVEDILGQKATLVVAPPWMGKTFLAKRLRERLRREQECPNGEGFGKYFCATFFEEGGLRHPFTPDWWESWQTGKTRACWIVDAIDEDFQRGEKASFTILEEIEKLTDSARERLCAIFFCRENELPKQIHEKLREIYDRRINAGPGIELLRLAPLTASAAAEIAGDSDVFQKICDLIKANKLHAVAGFPAVVDILKGIGTHAKLSHADIWRAVLERILRTNQRERPPTVFPVPPRLDVQFRAVSRVAALLMMCGTTRFVTEAGSSHHPSLEQLFPLSFGGCEEMVRAAQYATGSGVFRRSQDGWQFAHRHVQEWFSAFGISDLKISQLRPFVIDVHGQPIPHHQGVHALLIDTTANDQVRGWLEEVYGGLPPRSDAAPWSSERATHALARLLELARDSPFGLSIWADAPLQNFEAPGMDAEITRRLAEKATVHEKDLLLRVIMAIRATCALEIVERMVLNPSEDDHIRCLSAIVIKRIGGRADVARLAQFAINFQPTTRDQRELKSVLIFGLLEQNVWSLEDVLQQVPRTDEKSGTTNLLWHEIRERLTVDSARAIMTLVDWASPTGGWPSGVVEQAINLIVKQEIPSDGDYELLLPALLARRDQIDLRMDPKILRNWFAASSQARRSAYLAGLAKDPSGKSPSWSWRSILMSEDLAWLADAAAAHGSESPWLFTSLLMLAYHQDVQRQHRNKIRALVRRSAEKQLLDFDKNRKQYARANDRMSDNRKKGQKTQVVDTYDLAPLVQDRLDSPNITLQQQLHDLSWFCFCTEYFRPTNVTGEWEGLSADLQQRVLTKCQEALRVCKPTPIPCADSYPASISYEAEAFARVVQGDGEFLGEPLIRKWLPAALFATSDWAELLGLCARNSGQATEDVLVEAITRDLRRAHVHMVIASNVPKEQWTDAFALRVENLVVDDQNDLSSRCALVRVLSRHAPINGIRVANQWLARGFTDDTTLERTLTGIDIVLPLQPREAITCLEAVVAASGPNLLLRLEALGNRHWTEKVDFAAWDIQSLERVCDLLHKYYPPETDHTYPVGHAFTPTADHHIRRSRSQVLSVLLRRELAESEGALQRLASTHPSISQEWRQDRSEAGAAMVLKRISPHRSTEDEWSGVLSLDKALRLMDNPYYRVIRSCEDLQHVLLDELEVLVRDIKKHLPLLYGKIQGQAGRKRLNEDALQAYLFCRLNDRLPNRVLDVGTKVVFVDRETLGAKSQRLDIKVQAPTVSGTPATVVIEIKWSDNVAVLDSLAKQLGDDYLTAQQLTHGIYFVGWSGRFRKPRNSRRVPGPPIDQLRVTLEQRASEYRLKNPKVQICVTVVDLTFA
ncbi:MAG TPA: hypothetical protein VJZ71_16615 [Phycisphaerae bacterium]|nr:hypothetical protein [Phycisphaerae bacterium]